MTISEIIKLKTNNGRDIVDFLTEVMNDRYEEFRIGDRLEAARLLTAYGSEDARKFIADHTTGSSSKNRRRKS